MPELKQVKLPTPAELRKSLIKILPGYKWTVHKSSSPDGYLRATGIQTAGFNRLSTLSIEVRFKKGELEYEAKSAGFGLRAPWLSSATDGTLTRAVRALQSYYEGQEAKYGQHAANIRHARATTPK